MRNLPLIVARTSLAFGVAWGFIWLNWWVLPDLGFIILEAKGASLPVSGITLIGYENGEYIGSRVLKVIELGWSGVAAGWPYVLIGMLSGLSLGYVVGEIARRKLGVEEITREAADELRKRRNIAEGKESSAMRMLALSTIREEELAEKARRAAQEREQVRVMREEARQQLLSSEEKLKKAGMKEKDVANARDKVKRLEAKIESLEKTIDELRKSQ